MKHGVFSSTEWGRTQKSNFFWLLLLF